MSIRAKVEWNMLRSQWNRTPKSFIPAVKQEELRTPNLTVAPARRGFEDLDLYHQPQALLTYELSLKQRKGTTKSHHLKLLDQTI